MLTLNLQCGKVSPDELPKTAGTIWCKRERLPRSDYMAIHVGLVFEECV